MLNLFITPENKEYIFIIPESAKTDANGFYIIDKNFKEANNHLVDMYGPNIWSYLSHDLENRGLSSENTFYDRVDYITKNLVRHGDYLIQFIYLERMIEALRREVGYNKIGLSTDPYLNDVPMYLWDRFNSKRFIKKTYKYAEAASYSNRNTLWKNKSLLWSPSCNVSLAKQAGYILRERYIAAKGICADKLRENQREAENTPASIASRKRYEEAQAARKG